jgi:hypothetical protein
MALVICCVEFTDVIRLRTSFKLGIPKSVLSLSLSLENEQNQTPDSNSIPYIIT